MNSKWNLLVASAFLISLSNVGADTRNYKYLPGVVPILGQGFLVASPTALPAPCMTGMLPPSNSQTSSQQNVSQDASLNEEVVTSTSALKAALSIDMQMDASVLVYSGSGELNIDTEYSTNEHDVSVLIQGQASYGNEVLDLTKMTYRPDIQKLLDQGRIKEFREACGDEMVTTLNRGTSVAVVITMKDVDSDFQESVTSSASASGGIGPLSGSAKSKINEKLTTQSENSNVTIHVFVRGGSGLPDFADLVSSLQATGKSWAEIEHGVSEIFKSLTPDKAAVTGFVTESYPGVSDKDENLTGDQKTDALASLVYVYRTQLAKQKLIEGLLLQQEQTGSTPSSLAVLDPSIIRAAKEELPDLDQYLRTVAAVHQSCLNDADPMLQACKMPTLPPVEGVAFLYHLLTI